MVLLIWSKSGSLQTHFRLILDSFWTQFRFNSTIKEYLARLPLLYPWPWTALSHFHPIFTIFIMESVEMTVSEDARPPTAGTTPVPQMHVFSLVCLQCWLPSPWTGLQDHNSMAPFYVHLIFSLIKLQSLIMYSTTSNSISDLPFSVPCGLEIKDDPTYPNKARSFVSPVAKKVVPSVFSSCP